MKTESPTSIQEERINWEMEVIIQIEIQAECNTSDAQAILEGQPFIADDCFEKNYTADRTARRILNA